MPPIMSKRRNYLQEDFDNAVKAIQNDLFSVRGAAKNYGIPFSTLQRIYKSANSQFKRFGPKPVLTDDEELCLVKWLEVSQKVGQCRQEENLLDAVQTIVLEDGRETPFVNGRPGRTWLAAFYKRHPQLTKKTPELFTKNRENVSEESFRNWFSEVHEYLNEREIACL